MNNTALNLHFREVCLKQIRSEKDSQDKQDSNLHLAVIAQDIEKVDKYCKKIKADDAGLIDELNGLGLSPMHIAIEHKNEELVDLLLENGASPNKTTSKGESPLILAIKNNLIKIISRLIEEHANVNQNDASGNSPLKIATELENQEIMELLIEHGAFLARNKPQQTKAEDLVSKTKQYLDNLFDIIRQYTNKNMKIISFNIFYEQVTNYTKEYLNIEFAFAKQQQQNLESKLDNNFNQLLAVIASNACGVPKKEILNVTRKVIVTMSDYIKKQLLTKGDNDSIYLMSRAESAIEEEIVKFKNDQTLVSDNKANHLKPRISTETKPNLNNSNNFATQNSIVNNAKFADIKKEKILARKNNHDVELIDFVTIKPHHPRTSEEAKQLLTASLERLSKEGSKKEAESSMKQINSIVGEANKEKRGLTTDEGILIDKILRPGKTERMHILNFPTNAYEEAWEDLTKEAFETGATIHSFNYQEDIIHKNDLVYVGIAAVNKLLDDGIHPDKIILQGYGNGAEVVKEVRLQFEKRLVSLTQIDYAPESQDVANHRYICISHKNKIDPNCDHEFKKDLNNIVKDIAKVNFTEGASLDMLHAGKDLSVFQIINIFIKANQDFLDSASKYKNPNMPRDRVEAIIGLTEV